MKVEELIRHFVMYHKPSEHVAAAIWQVGDVISRAKQRKIKLTRKQAIEIIETIDHKQDCSLGITWDTIDEATDMCLKEQE